MVSQENVDVLLAIVEHFNEGDRNVPTEYLDPEVELDTPFSSVSGTPFRGYAGIEQWLRELDEHFSEWQNRIDEAQEVDKAVIAFGSVHLRGRASDVPLDQAAAWVGFFGPDHRVTRASIYLDRADALKAVGLEE